MPPSGSSLRACGEIGKHIGFKSRLTVSSNLTTPTNPRIIMSRSRRKTPIIAMSCRETEKQFKKQEHGKFRAKVRSVDLEADPREFGNPWAGPKDGKQYIANRHPHLLRK